MRITQFFNAKCNIKRLCLIFVCLLIMNSSIQNHRQRTKDAVLQFEHKTRPLVHTISRKAQVPNYHTSCHSCYQNKLGQAKI